MKYLFFVSFIITANNLFAQSPWVEVDTSTLFYSDRSYDYAIENFGFTAPDTGFMMPLQLRTIDGGKTWSKYGFSGLFCGCTRKVKFINPHFGYATRSLRNSNYGNLTPLFITNDGGISWVEITQPFVGGEVDFVNDRIGYSARDNYDNTDEGLPIYKTNNGGETWDKISVIGYHNGYGGISAVTLRFRDEQHGILSAIYHDLNPCYPKTHYAYYLTSDGGLNWIEHFPRGLSTDSTHVVYQSLYEIDPIAGNSWAGQTFEGGLWISNDDGLSWVAHYEVIGWSSFVSEKKIYSMFEIDSNSRSFGFTSDRGLTWHKEILPPLPDSNDKEQPTAIYFFNDSIGYIGSIVFGHLKYYGRILRTSKGIASGIPFNIHRQPIRLIITSNPITTSADFQFDVLKESSVFELFDLLGRSLLRQQLSAGQAALHLDMQKYPAGIYFARLGGETVRFIKLKA